MNSARSLAVVTGASSGIGLELAKLFAADGYDLVVAAENDDIHAVAEGLGASGVSVEAVQVDLATDEGVDELYRVIQAAERPVDAVALNAGRGAGGAFANGTALDDELEIIDLNVRSTVHLAKYVVRDMVERGEGRILFTLRAEMLDTKVGAAEKDDPADVARDGFEAMMAGHERVVSHSASTKAQARTSRLLPDSVKAEMHRRQAEPGSADK